MNTNTELIFRALCAFYDGEYANITYYSLRNAASKETFQDNIKILKKLGLIEDCSFEHGIRRFKIFNPVGCPDFIFDERFNFQLRAYLLDRWNTNNAFGNFVAKSVFETKLQLYGTSSEEIIKNAKLIKKEIEAPEGMYIDKTPEGIFIKNISIPKEIRDQTYHCKYCGDTNREHFGSLHTVCKDCYNKQDRLYRQSYAERLYKNSKQNSRHYPFKYDITPEYIQQILEKQNYKCAYSGITFSSDRKNKFTYPTIDRIDSNKGYEVGNICICTHFVNMMKNNCSVEKFKDIITKIYNNLDNF